MPLSGLLTQEPKDKEFVFDPTLSEINKETDTVQGQLGGLLSRDSPYLARARANAETRATEEANARGLQNTSMAVQGGVYAGEEAAMNAALPIATKDAEFSNTARLTRETQAADLTKQRLVGDQAVQLTQLESTNRLELANLESTNRLALQASVTAAELYKTASASMTALMSDPNTSPEQKQSSINKQLSLLKSGLALAGGISNVNLGGLLDFSDISGQASTGSIAPTVPVVNPHQSKSRRSAWEAARLAGTLRLNTEKTAWVY